MSLFIKVSDLALTSLCWNKSIFRCKATKPYKIENTMLALQKPFQIFVVPRSFSSFTIADRYISIEEGEYRRLFKEERTEITLENFLPLYEKLEPCLTRKAHQVLMQAIGLKAEQRYSRAYRYPEQYRRMKVVERYGELIVGGIPDAISEDAVYEMKTLLTQRNEADSRLVAETQADIYAWLTNKPKIIIETFSFATGEVHTYERKADHQNAERVLKGIENQLIKRSAPYHLPTNRHWMCNYCEYRLACSKQEKTLLG